MTASREFIDFVLDQLTPLGPVVARRMFGSVGVFLEGRMFALVDGDNRLYIKADAENASRFTEARCERFTYVSSGRTIALPYYAPPESVLELRDELLEWAHLGLDAALRTAPRPKPWRQHG